MASGPVAFRLTLSPYKVVASKHTFSVPLTLTNGGPGQVKITSSVISLGGSGTQCHGAPPPSWVTVRPASLSLGPGQTGHALLTVDAPASAAGSFDMAAMFAAKPVGHGAIKVGAGVGSRIELTYPGTTAKHSCATVAQPKAASHTNGTPVAGVIGLVVFLGLVALAVWAVLLRRRHRAARP